MRIREYAAKIAQVNAHYGSDAKFINDRDPSLAAEVRAGKITIQEALRQLGRVTQRDRNRERKALVISLLLLRREN